MSYDPYGYGPDAPPPDPSAPAPDAGAVRERVQLPAIFLIVVGVLNLLFALYMLFSVVRVARVPAEQLVEQQRRLSESLAKVWPDVKEIIEQQQKEAAKRDPEEVKRQGLLLNGAITAGLLLASLLVLFGGVRMLKLRSYGLAVLGSVVVALPLISFPGCCCMGQVVGLWSLLVLMNADVKAVFR